jgi:type VI secretion system protein ImpF
LDIEEAILAFEPRFLSVRVALIESTERLEATLRLRIDAVLHAEPMPEPITFDTIIDPTTDNIVVRTNDAG